MNASLRSLFAFAFTALAISVGLVSAQGTGGGTAALQFRNETKGAVIVQGTSAMNGMLRRGQPMLLQPGRSSSEFNVPAGFRLYSVYDANQPTQVLVRDKAIMVQAGRDQTYSIVVLGIGNQQVAIVESK